LPWGSTSSSPGAQAPCDADGCTRDRNAGRRGPWKQFAHPRTAAWWVVGGGRSCIPWPENRRAPSRRRLPLTGLRPRVGRSSRTRLGSCPVLRGRTPRLRAPARSRGVHRGPSKVTVGPGFPPVAVDSRHRRIHRGCGRPYIGRWTEWLRGRGRTGGIEPRLDHRPRGTGVLHRPVEARVLAKRTRHSRLCADRLGGTGAVGLGCVGARRARVRRDHLKPPRDRNRAPPSSDGGRFFGRSRR
jgi:hypothetical protein